jgi:hypothetical protein
MLEKDLLRDHSVIGTATPRRGGPVTRCGAGDALAVPALRKDGTRLSVEFEGTPPAPQRGLRQTTDGWADMIRHDR